jgi:FtsZ-interacting cell division protein ZipA
MANGDAITIDDDSENEHSDDESDVSVVEQPPKRSKTVKSKAETTSKSSSKQTSKSKPTKAVKRRQPERQPRSEPISKLEKKLRTTMASAAAADQGDVDFSEAEVKKEIYFQLAKTVCTTNNSGLDSYLQ